MPPKIAVLASFNADLVMRAERPPRPGETLQGDFAEYLGGKGFNQAVAARRLGAEVAVCGRVGDDAHGRAFCAALDRERIDRTAIGVDAAAGTGVATIVVDARGENSIVQAPRANRALTPDDVAAVSWDGVTAAILNLETSMPAAVAFAHAAHDAGVLVLLNPAPAGDVPPELLALVGVLVPNAIEAQALTGLPVRTPGEALAGADALRARGPDVVVITIGEQGAVAVDATHRIVLAAERVDVVDTVGAGDAFVAALAVSLAEQAPLGEALAFANVAGALACTAKGAEPAMPRRATVEALLARAARQPS